LAKADALRRKLEKEALAQARRAAKIIATNLDAVVPRDTGTLADSQEVRVEMNGPKVTAKVGYSAPHALWTDEGAKRHDIIATNTDNLWFEGTNAFAGRMILVQWVDHPGQKGTKWYSNEVTDEKWAEALEQSRE